MEGGSGVAGASSEVMSAHFLCGGSGTTHCRLKMASDTSRCLICVCVWPWGPLWILQEQGDGVQLLLLLNADTRAELKKKARTHTHTHSHNLDWVSQVQSICIHGRFCIGSTTYSVPSNCGTWLFTFTLRRPWTVLECVYGCIYGSMVLPEWIHLAECIFPLGSSLKILEGVCFDSQIDPPDTPTYAVRVSISRLIHLCPLHNQIPPCTFTRA